MVPSSVSACFFRRSKNSRAITDPSIRCGGIARACFNYYGSEAMELDKLHTLIICFCYGFRSAAFWF